MNKKYYGGFTETEINLLYKGLVEYENKYYITEDENWQEDINNLISYIQYIKNNPVIL